MKNCLSIVALFFLFLNLNAQTTWFGNGSGTANDPYQITRPEQLDSIRYFRDAESENKHFRLMNDIDLTAFLANTPFGWDGIGHKRDSIYLPAYQGWDIIDSLLPFYGHIYGGGHKITGFFSTYPYSQAAGFLCLLHGTIDSLTIIPAENRTTNRELFVYQNDSTGMLSNCLVMGTITKAAFAYQNYGTIKHCHFYGITGCESIVKENRNLIEDCSASINIETSSNPDNFIGGLVKDNYGTINNCHVTGSIQIGRSVGGIAYYNYAQGIIRNSYTSLEITASNVLSSYIGGVASYNNGLIDSCYTIGNLKGRGEMGGLIGRNLGVVSHSYALGDVTQSVGQSAGGLIGYNKGKVRYCYATGNINGNLSCGGLIGWNLDTIQDCYAKGNVTATSSNIGGFVGRSDGLIENCQASGNVKGDNNYNGGFVGDNNSGQIVNCQSTGNVEGGNDNTGGFVGQNTGQIENCHASGWAKGRKNVGGFAGLGTLHEISNSSSTGDAWAENYLGGFIGYHYSGNISRCFSTGNTTILITLGGFMGGFVGMNTGSIENCYATGDVHGANRVGGFAGPTRDIIRCCYVYNAVSGEDQFVGNFSYVNTANVPAIDSYYGRQSVVSAGMAGYMSPENMMKRASYPSSWDFDTVWTIREDITFPYFHWQLNLADTTAFEGTFVLNDSLNVRWRNNVDSVYFTVPYATTHATLSWIPDNTARLERNLLDHVSLSNGTNEFIVLVPVANGIQPKMCKVIIYKNNGTNDHRPPYLQNIFVSSGTVATVDTLTFSYTVNVSQEVDKITIDAEAFFPEVMISGLVTDAPLQGGENYFPIITRSGNGMRTIDYMITVIRAKSDNAFLDNMLLSEGVLSPLFHADSLNYRVNVPHSVDTISITGIAAHSNASIANIEDEALNIGANHFSILVTAEDGITTKNYTINVNRADSAASDNARLQNIELSTGTLSEVFNPFLYYYTVNLGYATDRISITGIPENEYAVVTHINNATVEEGNNIFRLIVIAENGATQIYYVVVKRESASASDNTKLSDIIVSSGTLEPAFNPDIYSYTVHVENLVDTISIIGTPVYENATVQNVENAAIPIGETNFNLLVSDGDHFQNYAVTVIRENADIVVITPEITFVVFEWQRREGAKRYRLVIYTNVEHTQEFERFLFDEEGNIIRSGTFQYTVENLIPATTYYYSMTAYDENDEAICIDEGAFTTLSDIGIPNHENVKIVLYPNPTTGILTIDNGQSAIGEMQIFDIYGRRLQTFEISETSKTLDISNFANGIYLIKLNGKTIKIIKQ